MRVCSQCGRPLTGDEIRCETCGSRVVKPIREASDDAVAAQMQTWLETLRSWTQKKWFWPAAGAAVIGLSLIVGLTLIGFGRPVAVKADDSNNVAGETRQVFDKLVSNYLPEKLEWGRELLKVRMPSYFPEELLIAMDTRKAEVKYSNPQKTQASYHMLVAYHFKETPKSAYIWMSAAFFFEAKEGKWQLTADKWPREWEVNFE